MISYHDELEEEFNRRIKRLMNISEEVKQSTQHQIDNKMKFGMIDDEDNEICKI